MATTAVCTILLQLFLVLTSLVSFTSAQPRNTIMAGYLPDYRELPNLNATASQLTDLFLFSIQPHPQGFVGGCCLQPHHYEQAREAKAYVKKQQGRELRTWITMGGAGRMDAFAKILKDAKIRKRLIQSTLKLCQREGADGIVVDGGIWVKDQQLLLQFLKEASRVWKSHGLLVATTHHREESYPVDMYQWVDFVHFMAYDMVSAEPGSGGHAAPPKVLHFLRGLLEKGCPPDKILLGIPLYARLRSDLTEIKAYGELFEGYVKEHGGLPASDVDAIDGYEYDSLSDLGQKASLTKQYVGGIYVWELGNDFFPPDYQGGYLVMELSRMVQQAEASKQAKEEL